MKVEADLEFLKKSFDAIQNHKAYQNLQKLQENSANQYLYIDEEDHKIFKNNWATTITEVKGEVQLRPMQYGLIPNNSSEEKITSYVIKDYDQNSLRALLPIKSFHLASTDISNFSLKNYSSTEYKLFYAPIIYENWFSQDRNKIIQSFNILCHEAQIGLTPYSLSKENALAWLSDGNKKTLDSSPSSFSQI